MSSPAHPRAASLGAGLLRRPSSLSVCARLAAAFYFLAVAIAVFAEFFAPGRLGVAATVLPVACSAIVTLLLYRIFRLVSPSVALLAVVFNLVGLLLEAVQWQPRGVNLAMVLHGMYAILLGGLMARSRLLPRWLGLSMTLAGVVWLLYLAPSLMHRLAPFNTAVGLLGEAAAMLWFLVMGVRAANHLAPAPVVEVRS